MSLLTTALRIIGWIVAIHLLLILIFTLLFIALIGVLVIVQFIIALF